MNKKYIIVLFALVGLFFSCKNDTKEVKKEEVKKEEQTKLGHKDKVENKVKVGDSTLVYKVSLGVLPDLAYEGQGVKIVRVTKDRPGFIGGLKEGDIVMKIDSKPVKDLIEYTKMLGKLKKGDSVVLDVKRDGHTIKTNIVFD